MNLFNKYRKVWTVIVAIASLALILGSLWPLFTAW